MTSPAAQSDPDRVAEILGEALEREAPDRPAFLESVCADAPGLRAEVESLLRAHDGVGSFLEQLDAERGCLAAGSNCRAGDPRPSGGAVPPAARAGSRRPRPSRW